MTGPETGSPPSGPKNVERLLATINPFDTIRQSKDGIEFWSARDLMPMLGYERWENFADAVARAKVAADNSGATPDHFRSATKVIEGGRWGKQTVEDYHVTRYGAYLVAMNGDPRKPEIAAAQTYFAVKTREAEVAKPALPMSYADALRELAATVEERDAAAAALAIAAPAADAWNHLASANGDFSVADAAKILSRDPLIEIGRDRLFTLMSRWGWVYRPGGFDRWRVYQTQIETGRLSELPSSHYHPRTGELVLDPPQVRVTAKGLQEIRTRLIKEKQQ